MMGRLHFSLSLALVASWAFVATHATQSHAAESDEPKLLAVAELKRDKPVDFEHDVLPLLKKNCVACHNATTAENKLNLESPQSMLKGGEAGPAVVPTKGLESLLVLRARGGGDGIMPPEDNKVAAKPLTADELGLIKLWIDQGAKASAKSAAETIQWQPLPLGVNPIYAVALTEDGQYAASGRANQIFIYQVPTGRFIGKLTDPAILKSGIYKQPGVADLDLIQSLAFSPDGMTLASGGYRTAKLWQRRGNVRQREFKDAKAGEVKTLAVSADGKLLATAGADHEIRLWDLATGKLVKTLAGHSAAVSSICFSADAKLLYSASLDKSIRRWQLADGKQAGQIDTPGAVTAITLINGGAQVASAGGDNRIRIWKTPQSASEPAAKPIREITGTTKPVVSLVTMPQRPSQIVSGSEDGLMCLWETNDGKQIRQFKHGGAITAVAVRPDGQRLASAGADKIAKLWNANDAKLLAEVRGDRRARLHEATLERNVTAAKSNVTGTKAEIAEAEKNVVAENDAVKKAKEAKPAAEKVIVEKQTAAKKAADEKVAAEKKLAEAKTAAEQAKAKQGDADKKVAELDAAAKAAAKKAADAKVAAAKKRDDKALAEAQKDAEKQSATAQAKLAEARKAKTDADRAATSADAGFKQLTADMAKKATAATDADAALQQAMASLAAADKAITSATTAAQRATDRVPRVKADLALMEKALVQAETDLAAAKKATAASEQPIRAIAFSPDNLQLATAGDDRLAHTWSAETGAALEIYEGHAGQVGALAFADDRRLLSAGADKTAAVWDTLPEWTWVRTLGAGSAHEPVDRVTALDFSPDGKLLAMGGGAPSRGGEFKIWNVGDGSLVRDLPDAHSDTLLGVRFSADGKFIASCGADKFIKLFDVPTGTLVRAFEGHTHHVLGVAWMSDGKVIASGGADNVIKVWDVASGDQKRTILGFSKEVTSVNFVGDTHNVLGTSGDKTVRIFNVDTGANVRSFSGGTDFMYSGAVTPDGKLIAAGGQDSVLRTWNGDTGQTIRNFDPPPSAAATAQAKR
jgi:WD40 repeat protein